MPIGYAVAAATVVVGVTVVVVTGAGDVVVVLGDVVVEVLDVVVGDVEVVVAPGLRGPRWRSPPPDDGDVAASASVTVV